VRADSDAFDESDQAESMKPKAPKLAPSDSLDHKHRADRGDNGGSKAHSAERSGKKRNASEVADKNSAYLPAHLRGLTRGARQR